MIIAQLTDIHIQDNAHSVPNLLTAIDRLNHMVPIPDIVLITGDLTDHGDPAEYDMVRNCLDQLNIPYSVVPGNHDNSNNFRICFADLAHLQTTGNSLDHVIEEWPVRLIGLDTSLAGQVYGRITGDQLQWLENCLNNKPNQPTLIFMHHPPFLTGISGLDLYPFDGIQNLERLIKKTSQVETLICGHVHRLMTRRFGNAMVVSAPSTAFQFNCDLQTGTKLSTIKEPAGFLLHLWIEGAGLVTHNCFIDDYGKPSALES